MFRWWGMHDILQHESLIGIFWMSTSDGDFITRQNINLNAVEETGIVMLHLLQEDNSWCIIKQHNASFVCIMWRASSYELSGEEATCIWVKRVFNMAGRIIMMGVGVGKLKECLPTGEVSNEIAKKPTKI